MQRRSEGTSSVTFEVLIVNYQIYLINLLIFNCFTLNINLFINLFYVKFLFSENHIFRKQKRTAVYGSASLVSDYKLTQENDYLCYLRDINKFLRYRTLCKNILKCGFPTKGIKLTRFMLFEVLGVPQFWVPRFRATICQNFTVHENLRNTSETMEQEILACLIS